MQEIANEAGLAKSSIYTYFPNQESLFLDSIAIACSNNGYNGDGLGFLRQENVVGLE